MLYKLYNLVVVVVFFFNSYFISLFCFLLYTGFAAVSTVKNTYWKMAGATDCWLNQNHINTIYHIAASLFALIFFSIVK